MSESTQIIGVVGLGNMGLPMAVRLKDAGYDVRAVDRSEAALADAADAGIRTVSDVDQLAREAEIIVFLLPGSDIVDAVAADIAGIRDTDRRVGTIIEMSSSTPGRTRALAQRLALDGITLIDAPVSGGVAGAVAGTLTIMVGGEAGEIDSIRPILDVLGAKVIRVGDVGAGHAVKALNNSLSATHLLATNEAAVIAARFGVDPSLLFSAVNTSSGRSGSTENKMPKFILPGTFDSGFSSALLLKDLGIAGLLADETGVHAPIAAAVRAEWAHLAKEIDPAADHTEIIKPLERRNGVQIRRAASTEL